MAETSEQVTIIETTEKLSMQSDSERRTIDARDSSSRPPVQVDKERTHILPSVPPAPPTPKISPDSSMPVADSPRYLPISYTKKAPGRSPLTKVTKKQDLANAHLLQEECRRLSLSLFAREQTSVRSLGFTSSIGGEGKSFLATVTARLLAHDSLLPVTLIECNWDHPTLYETFGIPATPGLAEWLNGLCDEQEIRYEAEENLTVVPAGDGAREPVKLLRRIQQRGLQNLLKRSELIILDLPPVVTTSYGSLAASLVETVVVVVRSEVTPSRMLVETCAQLKDVSVHGIILNQSASRIPRWFREIL